MDLWKGKNPADMKKEDVDAAKFDTGTALYGSVVLPKNLLPITLLYFLYGP